MIREHGGEHDGEVKVNITKRVLTYAYLFVTVLLFDVVMFVYAEKPPENILKNGDFDLNLDGWHHWTHCRCGCAVPNRG